MIRLIIVIAIIGLIGSMLWRQLVGGQEPTPEATIVTNPQMKKAAGLDTSVPSIPTISFENRFVCKDGSYVLLRWAAYPDDGVLYSIAHVIRADSGA